MDPGVVAEQEHSLKEKSLYAESVQHNSKALYYIRSTTSAIAGACAGVLGLTNLYGFAFYLAAYLFVGGVIFLANCRTRSDLYFRSTLEVFTGGAMDNALSYVLWWTLLYGLVHIYQ